MTTTLRVVSTHPRLTRFPRSYGRAEERARTLARLVGSAEIQRKQGDAWVTVESFRRVVPPAAAAAPEGRP